MPKLSVAIAGAEGRMGRRLCALVEEAADLSLTGKLEQNDTALPPGIQVLIDFSSPEGFRRWLAACRAAGVAFVSGTTGLSEADLAALDDAAKSIAVLHATNMSLGVAVLNRLAAEAARLLGPDCDIEITETHHRHKKDAPSGTALTLADAILSASGRGREASSREPTARGAIPQPGGITPPAPGAIPIHCLRIGEVVGEHTVHFATAGERLELTHKATSRDTFALGALAAARWIAGKPPGRYGIRDVLGI